MPVLNNIIVATGSTVTVSNLSGLAITSLSTVAAGGLLDGSGTVSGNFDLVNQGTISGDVANFPLTIDTGTLTNSGTIDAGNDVILSIDSSTITNLAAGTLTGGVWEASGFGFIEFGSGSIVTDDATIILNGTLAHVTASSVQIDNSLATIGASGVLSLLNDRNFQAATSLIVNGTITLGGGTLSAPTNGLTIGAAGHIIGSGAVSPGSSLIDSGTIEASGGTLTLPQSAFVSGTGTLRVDPGASLVLQALGSYAQSIVNNGTIDVAYPFINGTLGISGAYSGTGGFLIQGGFDSSDRPILELPSTVSGNVAFDTNFGELLLDSVSSFNGIVSGFGNDSTIVLAGITNAGTATLSGTNLDIKTSLGSVLAAISLNTNSINYNGATFAITETGSKAIVTVTNAQPATCFAAGTRIRTQAGDVPVEHLAAGDIVHTHFAGMVPVVWIGRRHIDCRRHPDPSRIWPVRIAADAFAPGMPARDLLLSPDHAVFIDDVLIPIKRLIDGHSIAQEQADEVTYYHVELTEHDVLFADGLPAESYLENADRAAFDNASDLVSPNADFGVRRWEMSGCAALLVTGAKLDAVTARLRG